MEKKFVELEDGTLVAVDQITRVWRDGKAAAMVEVGGHEARRAKMSALEFAAAIGGEVVNVETGSRAKAKG